MKANIYNGIENLTKKEVIQARSTEKKQVRCQLADFGASLESAYKQLTAVGASTRNAANSAKGTYRTALQVVAACYPYQTAAGGLCTKTKDGYKVRTLRGTAAAYAVVRTAVCNFIDYKTGRKYAEVDRFEGGYKIYSGEWISEVGRRTGRDSAIAFAQKCVSQQIPGEVEFKWNVMSVVERWR